MPLRLANTALVLAAVMSASVIAAQDEASSPGSIVVIGNRAEQAEIAANQAAAITLRPPIDTPMPRRYAPICVKLFGIDPAYGELLKVRVNQNALALGLKVDRPGCTPNVWIGFTRNSKVQVEGLRKQQPGLFGELKPYEIARILGGSGAAQVWHAAETRSVDGRPIPIVQLNLPGNNVSGRPIETGYNSQYGGGRLNSPIRSDINGTIVVFDRDRANGRSVQQLADYATFRILAPVQDFATVPPGAMPSILMLFTDGADAPDGLTQFDWAYLTAYYKLDRGAKASAVHDATKRAMLDGTGTKLREKAASNPPPAL